MPPVVSIIIPNWNGRQFLARCLAATVQSAQDTGYDYECLVIDDASTDDSPGIVERHFSTTVKLIRQNANRGFGPTMNTAAAAATGEILVCLNNDLVAKPQLIHELVRPILETHTLFGVTGKTINWADSAPNHVSMAAHWKTGSLQLTHEDPALPSPTMFLQGGCCSMRRAEFLRLGGFCDLYAPGYWEDYDISYAALKAGWQNLYNPAAQAYHFGGGSMARALGPEKLATIKERNRHLFVLLNITDPKLLSSYLSKIPSHLALACEPRLKVRMRAIAQCVDRLPQISQVRRTRKLFQKNTDQAILTGFVGHGA